MVFYGHVDFLGTEYATYMIFFRDVDVFLMQVFRNQLPFGAIFMVRTHELRALLLVSPKDMDPISIRYKDFSGAMI